jgi:ELWxxDGT repeat protein
MPLRVLICSSLLLFPQLAAPCRAALPATLLKEIGPSTADGTYYSPGYFNRPPDNLNGMLVFPAIGPSGLELWHSDGTTSGTKVCREIIPGPAGHHTFGPNSGTPDFYDWQQVGGTLFFCRRLFAPPYASEVWSTDGTEPGTQLLWQTGGNAGLTLQSWAQGVWWIERTNLDRFILWTSDGTPGGTRAGKEIGLTGTNADTVTLADTTYAILADFNDNYQLWSISPDPARTLPIHSFRSEEAGFRVSPSAPKKLNGALYFFLSRVDERSGGPVYSEIWRMVPGGQLQHVITLPEPGWSSGFGEILPGSNLIYFNATYGVTQGRTRLWVTDGTAAGTRRATPSNSTLIMQPGARTRIVGDRLFTIHNGDAAGSEVWTCTGTASSTRRLSGSNPAPALLPSGGLPDNLTVGGDGFLYFDNETVENNLRVRRIQRVSATNPTIPESFGDLPWNALNLSGNTTLPRYVFWAHGRLYASCHTTESGHELYWWPAAAPATPFSTWAGNQGLSLAAADPLADPDKDSQPNLLEFLSGTLANSAASHAPPTVSPPAVSADPQATMTFRRMASSGLNLAVESSLDGLAWQPDYLISPAGTLTAQTDRRSAFLSRTGSNPEFITIGTLPAGTHRKIFLRVRATLP